MTSLQTKLRVGLLAGVGVIALQALPAAAQQASPPVTEAAAQASADADVVEEILVTARRRTESLQDVPIAVTASISRGHVQARPAPARLSMRQAPSSTSAVAASGHSGGSNTSSGTVPTSR